MRIQKNSPHFIKYVSHWNVILSHANLNCRVGNELWYDVKRGQKRIGTSEGTIHFLIMLLIRDVVATDNCLLTVGRPR